LDVLGRNSISEVSFNGEGAKIGVRMPVLEARDV